MTDDTPGQFEAAASVGADSRAPSAREGGRWRSTVGALLAVVLLPVVAWAAGAQTAPLADSGALAVLGIAGLAWAGRRRL